MSSPGVERPLEPALGQQRPHRGALVGLDRRPQLEHLPPPVRLEPGRPRALRHRLELPSRLRFVGCLAPVEGDGKTLVLDPRPGFAGERAQCVAPALGLGSELQTVDADVDDTLDTDEPRGLLARAPTHAGDQAVARRRAAAPPHASPRARPPARAASTIGASVPSTSSSTAARPGSRAQPRQRDRSTPRRIRRCASSLIGLVGRALQRPLRRRGRDRRLCRC